jgi:hypothetical protein
MIGDLCKPLNPGGLDTVRLVMNVEEADELRRWLVQWAPSHGAHAATDLRRILERCAERERELQRTG